MSRLETRFRPWLDELSGWPDLALSPSEKADFADAVLAGGAPARDRLANRYGAHANSFNALQLIDDLAGHSLQDADLEASALALAAVAYHRQWASVPSPEAGGLTNPSNRRRWEKLRAFLVAQTQAALRQNTTAMLEWRAILGRAPDHWPPAPPLAHALRRELNESGLFEDIEVSLNLKSPERGGARWIAAQLRQVLEDVRRHLDSGAPCMVELIRDPAALTIEWAVAYRLEETPPAPQNRVERVRLFLYDPRRGAAPVSLQITLAGDRVLAVEHPPSDDADSPAVQALRLVCAAPATPPLFGWRRWFRAARPWGVLWFLARIWRLYRERRLQAAHLPVQ